MVLEALVFIIAFTIGHFIGAARGVEVGRRQQFSEDAKILRFKGRSFNGRKRP